MKRLEVYTLLGNVYETRHCVCCNTVSQAMCTPMERDWQAVKCIFRYVRGTSHLDIVYSSTGSYDSLNIYSDADYADDVKSR